MRTDRVRNRVAVAAGTVSTRIGKPIANWSEADILALFPGRSKAVVYGYCSFIVFLIFRGYVRVGMLEFYAQFHEPGAYAPARPASAIRARLETTRRMLGYAAETEGGVGSVLTVLIYLLSFAGKPLQELTRADVDAFRTAYDQWYVRAGRRADGGKDARVFRLERYLVHWHVVPEPRGWCLRATRISRRSNTNHEAGHSDLHALV